MTFIYGTHVSKDNISRRFLYFPKILIFGVNGAALESQKNLDQTGKILLT